MMDINAVNDYLALHMQADFWNTVDSNTKNAAFKMASNDVCAYLGITEIDPLRIFQLCAVSEQTVFLAEHHDDLYPLKQVKSESIDGVGSREYKCDAHSSYSPRALAFLERELASLNGLLNISRG